MSTFKRRYLVIDPGPTTGICKIEESDLTVPRFKFHAENYKVESAKALYDRITMYDPDMVICESFQHRPNQQAANLTAVEYIGVVKLWCEQHDVQLAMQPSSVIGTSAFWSDDNVRVRQLKLYKKDAAPHGMDALRHFLYYVTFKLGSRYFLGKLDHESDHSK